MERIARDPRFFTYLRDCQAESLDVVLGDARLRLRDAPDMPISSSCSMPSAPTRCRCTWYARGDPAYRAKLAEGGILVFNLSNRYLDLDPVMGRQAEDAGLVCRIGYDLARERREKRAGKQPSIWAVMAANERDLGALAADPRWTSRRPRPDSRAWTDDYSDLARYLRWMPVNWTSSADVTSWTDERRLADANLTLGSRQMCQPLI